jgi:hypothetical protein
VAPAKSMNSTITHCLNRCICIPMAQMYSKIEYLQRYCKFIEVGI